jgi:heme/copper-type cytochrome/quinol oxidase subunit 3
MGMSQAVAVDHHGEGTSTGLPHRKLMMWAFLGSDCMFFGTLLATYLIYHGRSLRGPYPLEVFSLELTSLSTFVLLMSSLTMVLSLGAIQRDQRRAFRFWNFMTILFGTTFLSFQVYEFSHFAHDGLSLQSSLFGSSFYTLTGMHGIHVTIGVIWLLSLQLYALRGGVTAERALDVEIAGLYWHFVDIVWIAIFTIVYLMEFIV